MPEVLRRAANLYGGRTEFRTLEERARPDWVGRRGRSIRHLRDPEGRDMHDLLLMSF